MISQKNPQSTECRKPESNKSSEVFQEVGRNRSDHMEEEMGGLGEKEGVGGSRRE
jgi:hypothetical protein